MKSEWIVPLAVGVVSIVAGMLLYRYTLHEPQYLSAPPPAARVSQPPDAPLNLDQIYLDDLDGQARSLAEWKQPLLIVNFWAPWCAPCRREIPALIDIQRDYSEQVQIIGLSFDTPENVQNFRSEYAFNYPLLLAGEQVPSLSAMFGNDNSVLPFTAILDARRKIVYQHAGEVSHEDLEAQIKAIFGTDPQ